MNWLIVVLVVLSLLGSVLWVMPSPHQRMQARLRQEAMQRGLQVQMVRLTFPRQEGEVEAQVRSCIAYRMLRNLVAASPAQVGPWQVFRARGIADRGLPGGWCWLRGEDKLAASQLAQLEQAIGQCPPSAFSLESTPVAVSVYWEETGNPEALDTIYALLKQLCEQRL